MNLLPQASGIRPRVACEIAPEGVVAARADAATGPLSAVASVVLVEGSIAPGLKPGNLVDRVSVVGALRRALEQVGAKPNARNADVTLVIPDGACRVLLLDFDALPSKLSEALPLVRFRLKKLLPFDADDAMLSFQIMSQTRQMVRVLAVAIPRDVLAEYEGAVREAGFDPGAVLPSTLASLAAVEAASPTLVVNASHLGVTTAITREGILLLHRTVDLQREPVGVPAGVPPALVEPGPGEFAMLPLVDRADTAGEWARQEPLPEHGRNPYGDEAAAEAAVQNVDGVTGMPVPPVYASEPVVAAREPGAIEQSPYASPTLLADLYAEKHNSVLVAPTSLGTLTDPAAVEELRALAASAAREPLRPAEGLPAREFADEVAQAVSVAVAYFEDNLATAPEVVLSAGAIGAAALQRILEQEWAVGADDLRVRDLVTAEALAVDAVSARVQKSALAGVLGALRG